MAYNAHAMTFAEFGTDRWMALYDDIAWAADVGKPFTVQSLVGRCESIARYATKTQTEILRVHLATHATIPAPGDHVVRLTTKWLTWQVYHDDVPAQLPPRP